MDVYKSSKENFCSSKPAERVKWLAKLFNSARRLHSYTWMWYNHGW